MRWCCNILVWQILGGFSRSELAQIVIHCSNKSGSATTWLTWPTRRRWEDTTWIILEWRKQLRRFFYAVLIQMVNRSVVCARPNLKVWTAIEGKKYIECKHRKIIVSSLERLRKGIKLSSRQLLNRKLCVLSYSITPAMPTSRFIEKNERLVYVCNVMMLCLAQQLRLPLHLEAKAKKYDWMRWLVGRWSQREACVSSDERSLPFERHQTKSFEFHEWFFLLLHKSTQHTAVKHKFSPEIYTHTR